MSVVASQQPDEEVAIANNVRAEEGVTAIVTTVAETRDDVRWLKRAVHVFLATTAWPSHPTWTTC